MNHDDSVLVHYGVLGMKWGIRKKRNYDGSNDSVPDKKVTRRKMNRMSDGEIQKRIKRLKLEEEYVTHLNSKYVKQREFVKNTFTKFGDSLKNKLIESFAQKLSNRLTNGKSESFNIKKIIKKKDPRNLSDGELSYAVKRFASEKTIKDTMEREFSYSSSQKGEKIVQEWLKKHKKSAPSDITDAVRGN